MALLNGTRIPRWKSKVAFLSDAAAAVLQDRYPGWRSLGFRDRTDLADVFWLWLERCPSCGGQLATD